MTYYPNQEEPLWFPYKVANWLDISIQSVHNWTDKYADLLSGNVSSDGDGRQYNTDDCVILWTVKMMRDQKLSHSEIRARMIDQGERVIPTTTPDTPPAPTQPKSLTEIDSLRAKLTQREVELLELRSNNQELKEQITALKGEIKALERIIDKLTSK
jgi:DNA-binding transcriptional MerR regulator